MTVTLPKDAPNDFGWLLHGRPIDVLPDKSFDLATTDPSSSFLKP